MKTIVSLLIPIIFALISFDSIAADLVWTQASRGETTDKIDYHDFKLQMRMNERDLTWPYLNESQKKTSYGMDFYHRYQKGTNFKFNYSHLKFNLKRIIKNKHSISLKTGLYLIRERNRESDLNPMGSIEVLSLFTENLQTQFGFSADNYAETIFMTGPNAIDLQGSRVSGRIIYSFWKKRLSLKTDVIKNFFKNSVSRTYQDTELMGAIMKYPHWIRVGFGYHTLSFNRATQNYWSPVDFYAYGPRVDLSYVFNEKVQAYFGGNYNWFEENETFKGTGYYLRTGIRYGIREDYTIDLSYEKNESIQNNSSWVADSFFLNVNYFL